MLTAKEIEKEIYSKDGLYDRTLDKIKELRKEKKWHEIAVVLERSSQGVQLFYNAKKLNRRPKFSSILEYANLLGVE